jgi:hypothetical protein
MRRFIYIILLLIVFPVTSLASGVNTVSVPSPTPPATPSTIQSNITVEAVAAGGGGKQQVSNPDIYPVNVPILQNGKIGDVTAMMPKFANPVLIPLQREDYYNKEGKLIREADVVIAVLDVYDGYIPSRIKFEELETLALKYAKHYTGMEDIRYSVKYKDKVWGLGAGSGGSGAIGSNDGLTGGGIVGMTGYSESTADPNFYISFYLVKHRK